MASSMMPMKAAATSSYVAEVGGGYLATWWPRLFKGRAQGLRTSVAPAPTCCQAASPPGRQ